MTVGSFFFALCSIVSLVGAVVTIGARNPIRCAVGLLVTIAGIAGLFLRLNAQFLAAIQLIVYAGAVVVLFVFVIMLLGPDAGAAPRGVPKARPSRAIAGILMALLGVMAGSMLFAASGELTPFTVVAPEHGSVEAVGRLMFGKGIVPFELATALLIVAVVGAIAVAKTRQHVRTKSVAESPTERLFHGPLHPRDAGRPLPKEPA
ncbi:MAG TPA: NADH-quinone oxidoreductase subunit J [Polyangiaceae bacterium]|jgi:NADH-quinone oxidoreductase subunit J|nr:NADH-quinone oxidoreductase subunit J [Polyangiaceae bacterium]